eukprot:9476181-Pyramimonas_sp.AAC.1
MYGVAFARRCWSWACWVARWLGVLEPLRTLDGQASSLRSGELAWWSDPPSVSIHGAPDGGVVDAPMCVEHVVPGCVSLHADVAAGHGGALPVHIAGDVS